MRKSCPLIALALCSGVLSAEPSASGALSLSVSSLPEAQLALTRSFAFPLPRGDHFLFSGNKLTADFTFNASPLSLNAGAEAVLTPIALAQIKAGGQAGSGWNIPGLGNGLALNAPREENGVLYDALSGSPFEGLVWKVYGGGVLQFDLAALLPGDWNHLLFQVYQEINYRACTAAAPGQLWQYEAGSVLYRNGLNYRASYVAGYQLPASRFLNFAGFMAEMEIELRRDGQDQGEADPSGPGYGSPEWKFSALYNAGLSEKLGLTFILQLRTVPLYTEASRGLYYPERKLDGETPVLLTFYRAAAVFSWRL
ncbi:MAG: hypothetical protein LBU18_03670 [Treponema sp.]|jgi:hypothetical protein|nr:hypothetical protein [Treponema sp.]